MIDVLNNIESLYCPICFGEYSKEFRIPVCLKCGHTTCQKCLEELQSKGKPPCSFCMDSFSQKLNDNIIILETISLINSLTNKTKSISKFTFSYCTICNQFLSHYTSKIHYLVGHKLISLLNFSSLWLKEIADEIKTDNIPTTKAMFIVLYIFQDPLIVKIKNFKVILYFLTNENLFHFYGELIKSNSSYRMKIIETILSSDSKGMLNNENGKLHKGIIVGKNSLFVMHGIFLIENEKQLTGERRKVIKKGLGILNYNDITFFGIVKFSSVPYGTGFSLICGILNIECVYYFGVFIENNREFPEYSFYEGEIITKDIEKGIQVKRLKIENNKKKEFKETLNDNKFFKSSYDDLIKVFTIKKSLMVTNRDITISASFNFENDIPSLIEVDIKSGTNEISITPQFESYKSINDVQLKDCLIQLEELRANLIIKDDTIFLKGFETLEECKNSFNMAAKSKIEKITNKSEYGYIIKFPSPNEKQQLIPILFSFKFSSDIFESSLLLFDLLNDFFSLELNNCNIEYKKYYPYTLTTSRDGIILELDPDENMVYFQIENETRKKKKQELKNLNKMTIKDLLPNIFNMSSCSQNDREILLRTYNRLEKKSQKHRCHCIIF